MLMGIQKRDIVKCIILSLVTCGIYGIIWFVGLTDDVGRASGDNDFTGTKCFLLTLVTCGIYGIYWAYKLGKNMQIIKQRCGEMNPQDNSILYLVLELFGLGIIVYCLAQSDLNNLVDRMNGGNGGFGQPQYGPQPQNVGQPQGYVPPQQPQQSNGQGPVQQ